jgi:putative ABC transport system permease protein
VLGRRVKVGSAPDAPWRTIVGIVGDVRHGGFAAPVRPEMYEPYTQYSFPMMSFVVRTAGDPIAMRPVVQKLVAEIDPSVPVSGVSTLDERLSSSVTNTRFLSFVLLAFAGVAVLVASIGVYGVVALGIVQRTREIGVRLALGATRGQVLGLLLRQGLMSVIAGLVVGVAMSFLAGSALEGLLFGVTRHDTATFTFVPLLLATAALAAAYLPARRAVAARRSCVELLRD